MNFNNLRCLDDRVYFIFKSLEKEMNGAQFKYYYNLLIVFLCFINIWILMMILPTLDILSNIISYFLFSLVTFMLLGMIRDKEYIIKNLNV